MPRVLSLFSGLGGLDLGFAQEGFEIVLAADSSPLAVASYNLNLEPVAQVLDLNEPAALADADVVIGGPPCQSFSLVGRRRPDDERGRLVFSFLEIVRSVRPTAFVMENVPGIESSKVDGRPLVDVLVDGFEAAGYAVLVARIMATDYMVPQRRRRLFLLGRRDGWPVLPGPCAPLDISARAAIGDLGTPSGKGERSVYAAPPSPLAARLRSGDSVSLHERPRMSDTDRALVAVIPPGGNYRDVPDALSTPRMMRFKATGGRTTTYGRLHPDQPAYTINTYFRRPNVGCHFHYEQDRLITVREAMRFQTFPDAFELAPGAQDARNALVGNAVPPFVSRAIAAALRRELARPRRLAAAR